MKDLIQKLAGKNYHIYYDNFFTSFTLFHSLLRDGILHAGLLDVSGKGFFASEIHSGEMLG